MKRSCRNILFAGTIIIWVIKFGIRPYFHSPQEIKFFLSVAPNLIGSFLIPFGAIWFFEGKNNLLARIFHIRSFFELGFVCTTGFILLVMNEYLQRIHIFGRTFDYYDILFSAIGLAASYFVFSKKYSPYLQPAGLEDAQAPVGTAF